MVCGMNGVVDVMHRVAQLSNALWSISVEVVVVLQALRWAKNTGFKKLQILTDSLQVVATLCCISNATISPSVH